jgi:hypothetical protein
MILIIINVASLASFFSVVDNIPLTARSIVNFWRQSDTFLFLKSDQVDRIGNKMCLLPFKMIESAFVELCNRQYQLKDDNVLSFP